MSDEAIRPAMTPSEWAAEMHPMHDGEYDRLGYFSDAFAVMAKANASLFDNDPRKLTREDVDALAVCAVWAALYAEYDSKRAPVVAAAESALAKLRAILPPRP